MWQRFRDREAAGQLLAEELARLVEGPGLVAGIPRGGLAVGLPIARRLRAPLIVASARKLTAASDPEFAFGAIDGDGEALIDAVSARDLGLDDEAIEEAKARVLREIRRHSALHRAPSTADDLSGRTVVLVDDGLATGLTMRAALAHARRNGAARVIVAAPCASEPAARRFRAEADQFVCPAVIADFVAVGAQYESFPPVSEDEVAAILARAPRVPPAREGSP